MPLLPEGAEAQGSEEQSAPEQQEPSGDISAIAEQVGQGLAQISESMTTPEEKEQMSNILSMFVDLMEKKLGDGAGEDSQPVQGVPMEGGVTGVPSGPQSRM